MTAKTFSSPIIIIIIINYKIHGTVKQTIAHTLSKELTRTWKIGINGYKPQSPSCHFKRRYQNGCVTAMVSLSICTCTGNLVIKHVTQKEPTKSSMFHSNETSLVIQFHQIQQQFKSFCAKVKLSESSLLFTFRPLGVAISHFRPPHHHHCPSPPSSTNHRYFNKPFNISGWTLFSFYIKEVFLSFPQKFFNIH